MHNVLVIDKRTCAARVILAEGFTIYHKHFAEIRKANDANMVIAIDPNGLQSSVHKLGFNYSAVHNRTKLNIWPGRRDFRNWKRRRDTQYHI